MMMFKKVAFVLCSVTALTCVAADAQSQGGESGKISNREKLRRYAGGYLIVKDMAEGSIAIINAQTVVPFHKIIAHTQKIEDRTQISFEYVDGVSLSDLKGVKGAVSRGKGTVSVLVADLEGIPSSIINLPEERCCIVNVNPLKAGTDGNKTLHRVCVEVSRAFCFALQLPYAELQGGVYDPITSLKQLDGILVEQPGLDVISNIGVALTPLNIVPYRKVSYRKACQEGWAPVPTNELQQTVWDQVHAVPKNPIKIKFDPKKGR